MSSAEKAVVFDLDGTLLDTVLDLAGALCRALAAFGYPEHATDTVKGFLGNGSFMLVRRALPKEASDGEVEPVRARFRDEYEKNMLDKTAPYKGIQELLAELSSRGIKTAVVTNKDDKSAAPMIKSFFGESVAVCRGVREDRERKPAPGITLSVLDALGVKPENAVFVGDGIADFETAKNCNIRFIPVGYGYTDPALLFEKSGTEPVADVDALREKLLSILETEKV